MLLIARRTAVGAALLLIMPAAIWISGWKWHPGLSAGTMKLLGDRNGDAAMGHHYARYLMRLVSVVPAFSSASGDNAVSHSGRSDTGWAGNEDVD